MIETNVPLWAGIPAALLLIAAGVITVIGSLGLLRLKSFYARMHPPTMGATLGTGCALIASMLVSSVLLHRLVVHELLIALFMVLSAPVNAILLMRAARSRSSKGEDSR